MRIRRALVPLVLVVAASLSGCGGDDSDDPGTAGADASDDPTTSTSQTTEPGDAGGSGDSGDSGDSSDSASACDLLSQDAVATAVGGTVGEGVPSSGPAITGGSFTTCVWTGDESSDFGTATITLYENAAAADSARQDGDEELEGLGDKAYSSSFASVWVYSGDRSLFAQWYTLSGDDEENLPKSKALAQAAVDAL